VVPLLCCVTQNLQLKATFPTDTIIMSSANDTFLRMLAKSDSDMFIPKKLEAVKYEGKTIHL
jgi:hypothetical protein